MKALLAAAALTFVHLASAQAAEEAPPIGSPPSADATVDAKAAWCEPRVAYVLRDLDTENLAPASGNQLGPTLRTTVQTNSEAAQVREQTMRLCLMDPVSYAQDYRLMTHASP